MPQWLIISLAVVAAQFGLGSLVGGRLRRASVTTRVPEGFVDAQARWRDVLDHQRWLGSAGH